MTSPSTHADLEVAHDLAIRDFRLMESWNDAEASAIIAPSMSTMRRWQSLRRPAHPG